MKTEDEPVTPDEFLLRLVWTTRFKPGLPQPVIREAFEPRPDETDGISVFRVACLSSPEQALDVMAADKRDRYALALLPVSEVLALGLTVEPAKIEAVPGHAVLPELSITAFRSDRAATRASQQSLAEIASRNVVRAPTG